MVGFGYILDFLVFGGVRIGMGVLVVIVCYTCSLRAKRHCLVLVFMISILIVTVMLKRQIAIGRQSSGLRASVVLHSLVLRWILASCVGHS